MEMNLFGSDWLAQNNEPGFRWRRMRVAGDHLGASLYEIAPGETTWKYHYEINVDELLVVVQGQPHLRTPLGERALREGDCILLPAGPDGAHQVVNRTDEPVRVLIVGNWSIPRAVLYPDSNEIKVRWTPAPDDVGTWRMDDVIDYWDSEKRT